MTKSVQRRRTGAGFGTTLRCLIQGNLHEILWQAWKSQGDVASVRVGPYDMLLLSDPTDVKHVFQDVPARYGKTLHATQALLGEGISNAEGAHWRKHRLPLKRFFSHRELGAYFPLTLDSAERVIGRLAAQPRKADLETAALSITQEVIFAALFGAARGAERPAFASSFRHLVSNQIWLALLPSFMARWPTPWARSFHAALERIDRFVLREIRATGRERRDKATILGQMLAAQDAGGDFLFTEKEVRDDVVSLMLAGYETTAATLCWLLTAISGAPDVYARLRQECAAAATDGAFAYADLSRLLFGRAVVNEVLRLYPPAWSIRRIALEADELPSGQAIRGGDFIVASPLILQRHPEHWEAPHEFRPERFLDGEAIRRKEYAFMPFGGGPRRCLGMHFAYMELLTVLLVLMRSGSWRVEAPHPVPIHSRGVLKPAVPLALRWDNAEAGQTRPCARHA